MEELVVFFANYGLWITLIAIVGIVLLGVLKYCNLFTKIDEKKRHYIYLGISVGFSILATAIYLLVVGAFDLGYLAAVSAAMYALNQTFYAIFKVTPINELATKLLEWIVNFVKAKLAEKKSKEENTEENK